MPAGTGCCAREHAAVSTPRAVSSAVGSRRLLAERGANAVGLERDSGGRPLHLEQQLVLRQALSLRVHMRSYMAEGLVGGWRSS